MLCNGKQLRSALAIMEKMKDNFKHVSNEIMFESFKIIVEHVREHDEKNYILVGAVVVQ